MIKDTDEHLNEKIHRERSGRDLSTGASTSVELGYVTSLYLDRFTNLEPLQISDYWHFIEAS